jgi:cell division protein FtsL
MTTLKRKIKSLSTEEKYIIVCGVSVYVFLIVIMSIQH